MCQRRRAAKCDVSVKLSPKKWTHNNFCLDFPVLLNKWERLHNRIKENVQQTGVYAALKQDVISFKRDLAGLLERTEEPGHTDEDEELESRLHTFKVIAAIIFIPLNQLVIAKCQGDPESKDSVKIYLLLSRMQ